MNLCFNGVRFAYGRKRVLHEAAAAGVPSNGLTVLVGPNAAGKTTLLRCIAGLAKYEGSITLDGREVSTIRRAELTRSVSYLPQDVPMNAVLTVFEAVLLARQHGSAWRVASGDLVLFEQALRDVDIEDLATRHLNELSGGQRQLVSIAQALVRRPSLLLLDEPTSNLDLHRQMDVLSLLSRRSSREGMTTLVTLHDLNLASRFATHCLVLHGGRVYAEGTPAEVITRAMVRDVYEVHADVTLGAGNVPQVTAIASIRDAVASDIPESALISHAT